MKYKWICKCGAMGKDYLPRHKAIRGAKGHIKRTGENLDVVLVRVDGLVQYEKGGNNYGSIGREIQTAVPA